MKPVIYLSSLISESRLPSLLGDKLGFFILSGPRTTFSAYRLMDTTNRNLIRSILLKEITVSSEKIIQ